MKTQCVKNFFTSPFTVHKKEDPKTPLGKIKTWEKVLLVAFSILLVPTIIGAPLCLFLGSALARRRNVQDLTRKESQDINLALFEEHFPEKDGFKSYHRLFFNSHLSCALLTFTKWVHDRTFSTDSQDDQAFKLNLVDNEGEPAFHILIDCKSEKIDEFQAFRINLSDGKFFIFPNMEVDDFLSKLGEVIYETLIEVKGEFHPIKDYITITIHLGDEGNNILPHLILIPKANSE